MGERVSLEVTMGTSSSNRRSFLKRLGLSAAGVGALPNIVRAETLGNDKENAANNRMNLGVIGMGGRGNQVMRAFMAQPDVRVVAVCDVDRARRKAAQRYVNESYRNEDCDAYIDFRELLARQDIDIVLIATGDNNHSNVAIQAARAGKDMYCEKPMSVTIEESRAVADTMKRLGRIFQCGTQRRSIGHFRFAVRLAHTGKLGEIVELQAEQYTGFKNFSTAILEPQEEPRKEMFDWDGWLGPAQWRPYNSEYHQRRFWGTHVDFSGGAITEWGSHTGDICQWANQADDTSPIRYWQEGDRYIAEYANGAKLVFLTGLRFGTCPVKIIGTEGWVETGDTGEIDAHPKSLLGDRLFEGGYPPDNHVRAFLDCVLTRQEPVSNAEVAHRSITACHVANIAKRLGREVQWDPKTETIVGDEEAQRLTTRAYREPWYL